MKNQALFSSKDKSKKKKKKEKSHATIFNTLDEFFLQTSSVVT